MAKIIENIKGFKVIEISLLEVATYLGGFGICDLCSTQHKTGFYIAVLNSWYCPKCYDEFTQRATRYTEDTKIEDTNFNHCKKLLEL